MATSRWLYLGVLVDDTCFFVGEGSSGAVALEVSGVLRNRLTDGAGILDGPGDRRVRRPVGIVRHGGSRRHGGRHAADEQQHASYQPTGQGLGADGAAGNARRKPTAAVFGNELHQQTDDEVKPAQPHHTDEHGKRITRVEVGVNPVGGRHLAGPRGPETAVEGNGHSDGDGQHGHQSHDPSKNLPGAAAAGGGASG